MSTILSTYWFSKELWVGNYAFWTQNIGFGMPQPFSQYLWFHPLMPLFGVAPMLATVLFYIIHLILSCYGIWLLGKEFKFTPGIGQLCCFTYLLSSSCINYTLMDFWPSVFLTWAMLPFIFLFLLRLLQAEDVRCRVLNSLALGLVVGFDAINSHAGVFATYVVSLAFFAFFHGKKVILRIPHLALAGVVAIGIAASKIFYHNEEMMLFAKGASRTFISVDFFSIKYIAGTILGPLCLSLGSFRIVWFGTVFLILAIGAAARSFQSKDVSARAFALLFFISPFLINLPQEFAFNVIAWPIAFRDPAIIAGILLAGIALERLKASDKPRFSKLVGGLSLLQVMILVVSVAPIWLYTVSVAKDELSACSGSEQLSGHASVKKLSLRSDFICWLDGAVADKAGRLYYSPGVASAANKYPNAIQIKRNALAYHGFKVVPGYFKGIFYNNFYPSSKLMHGLLLPQDYLMNNSDSLDVLAIRYVLALEGESVAKGLSSISSFHQPLFPGFTLYENSDAWPEAVLLDTSKPGTLARLDECEHDQALCADYSPLLSLRKDDGVVVENLGSDSMSISLKSQETPSVLMATVAYRSDWVAYSLPAKQSLEVSSLFGGFIGIQIPPQTEQLMLVYRPVTRIVFDSISWIVLFGVTGVYFVLRFKWQARRSN
ncbi:MAG: hypothetical protein JEY79_07530 [Pseudodesulfovibrio sp.]|nr:hypothetical protein [Pseudodesulfovibrio sp.]